MSPDARKIRRLSYPRVGVAGQGCHLGRSKDAVKGNRNERMAQVVQADPLHALTV